MSNSRPEDRQNSSDNVFRSIHVGADEPSLFATFINANDFSANTRRAMIQDVRKFALWFAEANSEPFVVGRVTTRDISDFRDHLRRDRGQAVNTVNRCLVTLRRFLSWLADEGHVSANVAKPVKELRRQQLAPQGLERPQVRRLLREVELRGDLRAAAIFNSFLYTGCRIGDLVGLDLQDLMIAERSGTAVFQHGKGNKQRSVPLPLAARRTLQTYLETRPPVDSTKVFVGERGPLTDRGVRCLFDKYSLFCGFKIYPHLLRHTFAHQFLADNENDLVSLAQILGHENLNTTKRYVQRTQDELGEASDRLSY
jgi:site-specific recombinase XerD